MDKEKKKKILYLTLLGVFTFGLGVLCGACLGGCSVGYATIKQATVNRIKPYDRANIKQGLRIVNHSLEDIKTPDSYVYADGSANNAIDLSVPSGESGQTTWTISNATHNAETLQISWEGDRRLLAVSYNNTGIWDYQILTQDLNLIYDFDDEYYADGLEIIHIYNYDYYKDDIVQISPYPWLTKGGYQGSIELTNGVPNILGFKFENSEVAFSSLVFDKFEATSGTLWHVWADMANASTGCVLAQNWSADSWGINDTIGGFAFDTSVFNNTRTALNMFYWGAQFTPQIKMIEDYSLDSYYLSPSRNNVSALTLLTAEKSTYYAIGSYVDVVSTSAGVSSTGWFGNTINLMKMAFNSWFSIFGLQIAPGITLGMLILAPIFAGLLIIIFKAVKQ